MTLGYYGFYLFYLVFVYEVQCAIPCFCTLFRPKSCRTTKKHQAWLTEYQIYEIRYTRIMILLRYSAQKPHTSQNSRELCCCLTSPVDKIKLYLLQGITKNIPMILFVMETNLRNS